MQLLSIQQACEQLNKGHIIAYPTEAVFGLGCDPDNKEAVLKILTLKNRSIDKGLILVASHYSQLQPYLDETRLTTSQKQRVINSWPGPYTWIMPKNKSIPFYLTGKFDSIAVRVSNHPVIKALCQNYAKPIVSTSANLSGQTPCQTALQIKQQFGEHFPTVEGEIGQQKTPTQIKNAITGQIIR